MADIVFPGQAVSTNLNADALPSNSNIEIYKGDYVEVYVTLQDSAGVPLLLSGTTPKAVLKSDYADMVPKPFTCTLTGTNGEVRIFMSSAVTSTLLPGSYIWDFQITFAGGETRTYLAGDVIVYNEVTT